MNKCPKKPELLSPAGSFEALKAAIINGADAVYLGIGSFNARASAENFTVEGLPKVVDYAHLFGVKIYLAINTLMKDSEIQSACDIAAAAFDMGVSAIIVQDIGLASLIRAKHPHIVLHASTQLGVHNLEGALAAKAMGFERIILSRETPLSQIKSISQGVDIELEYFVHGALCCGFSGNCYFSSLVAGMSGNRGRCLQLCRKSYQIRSGKLSDAGYYLSTRDTMLVEELSTLFESGICSFKIEGRMRRTEYVGEATRIYRKAIDSSISKEDIQSLRLMYNRGNFSKAHLNGSNEGLIYPLLQSHMGVKIGSVTRVLSNRAELSCKVAKGDGIKFLRRGKEVGHALVLLSGQSCGYVGRIQVGDEVYLTDSAKKNDEILSRSKKLPIQIKASFHLQEKSAVISLLSRQNSFDFAYNLALEVPQKNCTSVEEISECLTALGNTDFECQRISIFSDAPFFVPKSALKQLRRAFISDFEKQIISSFDRPIAFNSNSTSLFFRQLQPVNVQKASVIIMCEPSDIGKYEAYADYVVLKPCDYKAFYSEIKQGRLLIDKTKHLLDLPLVAFDEDISLIKSIIRLEAFDKFVANNIYALEITKGYRILLGYKLNMLNSHIDFPKVVSIEEDKISLLDNEFAYVFGKPDIMHYVYCYYRRMRGCDKCRDESVITITDDKSLEYQIRRQKITNCYNYLVSSLPKNLTQREIGRQFLDATNLNPEEKLSLMDYLKNSRHHTQGWVHFPQSYDGFPPKVTSRESIAPNQRSIESKGTLTNTRLR